MAVSLSKGGTVSLSKEAPGLTKIMIGLGWDARATDGADFDLDASIFLLTSADRVKSDQHFVFYNNNTSPDGAVVHLGDNRSGAGAGDDEQINVELTKVDQELQKISVAVTIHEAEARRQNFGQVRNAFIRVVNQADNKEIARYDLSEEASTETAMIFGEVYRYNQEWKFRAVGQGFAGGLRPLALHFGVNV
jgi:tellurium resistance protein TerD